MGVNIELNNHFTSSLTVEYKNSEASLVVELYIIPFIPSPAFFPPLAHPLSVSLPQNIQGKFRTYTTQVLTSLFAYR